MFSRTLLFRQILSGLKRFPAAKPRNIPHLSGLKRFLTDKLGLGDCLHDLSPAAVTYQ